MKFFPPPQVKTQINFFSLFSFRSIYNQPYTCQSIYHLSSLVPLMGNTYTIEISVFLYSLVCHIVEDFVSFFSFLSSLPSFMMRWLPSLYALSRYFFPGIKFIYLIFFFFLSFLLVFVYNVWHFKCEIFLYTYILACDLLRFFFGYFDCTLFLEWKSNMGVLFFIQWVFFLMDSSWRFFTIFHIIIQADKKKLDYIRVFSSSNLIAHLPRVIQFDTKYFFVINTWWMLFFWMMMVVWFLCVTFFLYLLVSFKLCTAYTSYVLRFCCCCCCWYNYLRNEV